MLLQEFMKSNWRDSNYQPKNRSWIGHEKSTSDTAGPRNRGVNFDFWVSKWTESCNYIEVIACLWICELKREVVRKEPGTSPLGEWNADYQWENQQFTQAMNSSNM